MRPAGFIVLAVALLESAGTPRGMVRTFESDAVGSVPSGFTFAVVRNPTPARWTVARDRGNSFLVHSGDASRRSGFALATLEAPVPARLSVAVRVRLASGERSGGVVWRFRDPDHYYLARLNLDEQDIGLYRVVNGNRIRIDGEDDLELDPEAWHTLKVVHEAETIRVYLGGIRVLRARDRTFRETGAVGLWCTGDSVAHFDDLRINDPDDD